MDGTARLAGDAMMGASRCTTQLALFCLTLMLLIEKGLGIECYVCNSGAKFNGPKCVNLPKDDVEDFKQHCDEWGSNFTMCRKIKQSVEGDDRIIRQCARLGDEDTCKDRRGTYRIKMTYCHCKGDLCNNAPALITHINAPMLLAISVLSFLFSRV